jgi:prepilin-type processing-associated H-X9-DG protein
VNPISGNNQVGIWCGFKIQGQIIGSNPNVTSSKDSNRYADASCAMICDNGAVYSFHIGGCNSSFGDGSVRFLQKNVDVGLLCALGTRDGGELTGDDY